MTRITRLASPRLSGFTLVEMVFTLVISGIILALAAVFITRPIQGYQDLTRRALLVNNAESALRQMAREIRNALPRSVRIDTTITGGGFALEMLPVIDGAMYRGGGGTEPGGATTTDFNRFNRPTPDTDFDIHRFFRNIPVPSTSNTHRLVVNNQGTTDNTAYGPPYPATGGVVITPLGTTITYSATGLRSQLENIPAHHINLNPAHTFRSDSPQRRLYVIEKPVTYLCVPNSTTPSLGMLTRYSNYPIQSTQPTTAATLDVLPGVIKAPVSAQVSACTINADFSSVRRYGLVTFELTLSDTTGGTVRLLHQVLVENSR